MNRDKDLIATTDAHHRPVRVHARRPGKSLQAKQSESLHAQHSAIQKPDQTEITCLTIYNSPQHQTIYSTIKMNIQQLYEVNIFKVLAIIYHRFHVET